MKPAKIRTKRDLIEFLKPFEDDIELQSEYLNSLQILYVWDNPNKPAKLIIGDSLVNWK